MRISAKEDYAIRAALELARHEGSVVKRDEVAEAQDIPIAFLENILLELKRGEIVETLRGPDGGVRLARPAREISVADVIRAVTGPLASVRGVRPPAIAYSESAEPLREVWVALRANIRSILEHVSLADLASGRLPAAVTRITRNADSWE
ncbi:MAG: Rrf2 family transcriptional regulator [Actinomycetota bacterium]